MNVKVILIILFFLLLTVNGFPQQTDTNRTNKSDTLLTHQGINPRLNVYYDFNEFVMPFMSPSPNQNLFFNSDRSTLWLRTELALSYSSQFNSNNPRVPNDLTEPLYRQYIENSKFNAITYILGMAQAAAAGYLAYKSIKKYGFWK